MTIKEQIKQLEDDIKYHQNKYYNYEPEISDAEYDSLFDKLKRLDPNNELLFTVGEDSSSEFDKVKHMMIMNSQQKASKEIDFQKWIEKQNTNHFVVEYKMDGASIELQYINGKFNKGVTRGDGIIGDDITKNVIRMKGLIKSIKNNFTGSIRGEIVLNHQTFKNIYSEYSNCRNTANGIMKRKDGIGCENLSIVVYDVFEKEPSFQYENDKLNFLESCGFNVVPYIITNPNDTKFNVFNSITKFRNELNKTRKTSYDFDIDGIVIKPIQIDYNDTKLKPDHQIAYKFALDAAETTLLNIEWSVSGSKRTPVAICNPVELCGTIVQRASLCNISLIKEMGLKIGSKVMMVKRGEIIPKIESVISSSLNLKNIEIPTHCEFCGSKLYSTDNCTLLVCPNEKCPETIRYNINYWINLNKIKYIGPMTIKNIQSIGCKLYSIIDLYKLSYNDLVSKGFSSVMAEKIISEINNTKKSMPLLNFITGFMPDGIALQIVNTILNKTGITTLDEFLNLSSIDLQNIDGVGESIISGVLECINKHKSDMIELSKYINIDSNDNTGKLSGLTFCVTGQLENFTRFEIEYFIKSNGGIISNIVNKKVNYLICNSNSNSIKYTKAITLKIPIITEFQLLEMTK